MPRKSKITVRTELTKVETCYIENNRGLPAKQLSSDLNDAPIDLIEAYLNQLNKSPIKTTKSKSSLKYMKPQNETPQNRGTIVFSPAASELADENRAQNIRSGGSQRFKEAISKVYTD